MQGRIEGFEKTSKNRYILGAIYIYTRSRYHPRPRRRLGTPQRSSQRQLQSARGSAYLRKNASLFCLSAFPMFAPSLSW